MKRREFIKAGAATATVAGAAGIGGAVGSACGGLFEGNSFDVGRIPLPEMDGYLRKVDDGMRRIAEWDRRDDIPETELDRALENELGKKALRALYMAGMFGDLPDAGQVHPGMQERVRRAMPEMGEAVADMAEFLSNVSEEDAEELRRYLNEKDNPGMEIAQWFDEVESALGVSARRRRQTRAFITQAVSRLKNQPPRLLFDEYVGKVERVAAQAGSPEEMERRLIARMGREAFFERQQRLAMYAAAWEQAGVVADDSDFGDTADAGEGLEGDGGVEADTGVENEPVDAGVVHAPADEKKPPREWKVDLSTKTCAELDLAKRAVTELYEDGLYTDEEFEARDIALRSERIRKECHLDSELSKTGVRSKRQRRFASGGVCLGISVVLLGVAGLMVAFGDETVMIAGAFVATPGAIVLVIGLVMLVVAAFTPAE